MPPDRALRQVLAGQSGRAFFTEDTEMFDFFKYRRETCVQL